MKKLLFGAFALALFAGVGCKKDKDEDVCALSSASFAGSYKITGATTQMGSGTETDIYTSLYEPCERDDVYTFNTNGTYTLTDAGVVCDPPNTDAGTWAISGNTVTIDGDNANISNFTCSGFTVVASYTDAGITVTNRIKFSRQ
ncbi:MAG: lipocalin family protein [Bacteroidetes bacterium]|nr:lipocalin family protein [Bacteroidota bacterium]